MEVSENSACSWLVLYILLLTISENRLVLVYTFLSLLIFFILRALGLHSMSCYGIQDALAYHLSDLFDLHDSYLIRSLFYLALVDSLYFECLLVFVLQVFIVDSLDYCIVCHILYSSIVILNGIGLYLISLEKCFNALVLNALPLVVAAVGPHLHVAVLTFDDKVVTFYTWV